MSDLVQVQQGVLLARGVCRHLMDLGYAPLTEVTVKTGRRMDVLALGPKGELWCIEVKSCREDFASDAKWPDYLPFCDAFFFAVPSDFPLDLLPGEQGLMVADAWGAEILRHGPARSMAASRRKAMTLRFGRLAAERLLRAPAPPVV